MVPSKAEYAKKGNVLVVSGKLDHGEEEILRLTETVSGSG